VETQPEDGPRAGACAELLRDCRAGFAHHVLL
jgi:hypothetical protein